MPLISVVIPVFNGERTIQETIQSVLNQTFLDLELIVINDGSTDSTLKIVSNLTDYRLKAFSYPNAGLSVSRNRGITRASSEYISFIDADDLWTPNKLEAQYKALQANPQAAVAYSWTDFIDEGSKYLRGGCYLSVNGDVYANLLMVNFLENGSNALFRRQALTEVGGFDESLSSAEDWDIYLRIAVRHHFVAVSSPQILYRVSASSMSSNVAIMEAASRRVLKEAFDRKPELKPLRYKSFGNLYKYLTYKALEGYSRRREGLEAARLFWQVITNDIEILKEEFIWEVMLKIALWIFLTPRQTERLITSKFPRLSYIHGNLLMYFYMNP